MFSATLSYSGTVIILYSDPIINDLKSISEKFLVECTNRKLYKISFPYFLQFFFKTISHLEHISIKFHTVFSIQLV